MYMNPNASKPIIIGSAIVNPITAAIIKNINIIGSNIKNVKNAKKFMVSTSALFLERILHL